MRNTIRSFNKLLLICCVSIIICSCTAQPDHQLVESSGRLEDLVSANIGTGLEIIPSNNLIDLSGNNWFSFDVVNSSNESIEFIDIHFGLLVFQYDEESEEWEQVTLSVSPTKSVIILPPGDRFSNQPFNSFSLNSDYFDNIYSGSDIRFFIKGIGVTSGEGYGAFVDLPVLVP